MRRTAIAALFVFAIACSKNATPTATTSPQSTPAANASASAAATTTAPSSAPGVPHCRTADLSGSVTQQGNAAGTKYDELTLTNNSSAACTLSGYPGVSLVDSSGSQIGQPASRNAVHPVTVVTLSGNGSAYSLLGFPNPGNFPAGKCSSASSVNLRVYPPGETQSLLIALQEKYCPGFSVAALSSTKG